MSRGTGFALVLLLAGAAGCAQSFDATSLGVPATMAAAPGEASQGTAFKTTAHSVHGLFGLVQLSQASLRKALSRQLVGGQAVTNLKIKTKSRWTDVLVTALTLGLVVPRTVEFQGVVVGRE